MRSGTRLFHGTLKARTRILVLVLRLGSGGSLDYLDGCASSKAGGAARTKSSLRDEQCCEGQGAKHGGAVWHFFAHIAAFSTE